MQAVPPVEHDASRCRKVSRRPTTARRAIAQAALILMVVGVAAAEGSSRPVHHITLEKLRIINYDNDQGAIAISTKCPAWGWIIRDNDIIGAGTGLYLGDSDGTAPFIDGLIENNLIVDTIGYNIEIKHQIERPDLPG